MPVDSNSSKNFSQHINSSALSEASPKDRQVSLLMSKVGFFSQ